MTGVSTSVALRAIILQAVLRDVWLILVVHLDSLGKLVHHLGRRIWCQRQRRTCPYGSYLPCANHPDLRAGLFPLRAVLGVSMIVL